MGALRRVSRSVPALIAATLLASSAVAQPAPVPTDAEMVRGLMPTVVNIRVVSAALPPPPGSAAAATAPDAGRPLPRVMSGSGFVVDPSGLIVTNNHVIDGAIDITVTFSDGESEPARVVDAVRILDLAVLAVAGDRPRPAVRWATSPVQPGDEVFAFGNPLGIGMSVTAGIVSAVNRDIEETPYDHFIQTDAVINHGNSGGPLFNTSGQVVGVDTVIISPTAGYAGLGFAIPADTVRFVIDRVHQYGWLRPGWIGMSATRVTKDMANAMGQAAAAGLMVAQIAPASPAAKAGLRVGDVILGFDGPIPTDGRDLQRRIIAAPIGKAIPVAIQRAGQALTIPVTVVEWPRTDYDRVNGTPGAKPALIVRRDLGLTLGAITDETRARHGLQPAQTGVLVTGVIAGTDAWLRGIGTGDVIVRVQDMVVTNGADVQREIDRVRALGRKFALFLVQKKDTGGDGPRWLALRIAADGGEHMVAKSGK